MLINKNTVNKSELCYCIPRPVHESIVTVSTDASTHSASVETDKATQIHATHKKSESDSGMKIAQSGEFYGEEVKQAFEVLQYEVVAVVPQSVAIHLHHTYRHDAVDHFLVDRNSLGVNDNVEGA